MDLAAANVLGNKCCAYSGHKVRSGQRSFKCAVINGMRAWALLGTVQAVSWAGHGSFLDLEVFYTFQRLAQIPSTEQAQTIANNANVDQLNI